MVNQIKLEGYIIRAWEHNGFHFMRLANNRPGRDGQLSSSDYVTVQIDPSLGFDPKRIKLGTGLLIQGRLVSRDVIESLGRVVAKSKQGVEIPGHLSRITVLRPTTEVLATNIRIVRNGRMPPADLQNGSLPDPNRLSTNTTKNESKKGQTETDSRIS